MEDLISFIVPAYNNEDTIGKCIESILAQSPNKEVIVVDNGSTDNTEEIISKFSVTTIVEKKRGSGAARNRGLTMVKGNFIAFVDADAYLPEDWSEKAYKTLKRTEKDVVGVGGPLLSMGKSSIGRSLDGLSFGKPRNDGISYTNALNASGVLFKRSVFNEIRFDEEFIRGQDTEIGFRMRQKGFKLLYDSNLVIYHKNPTTMADLVKKWFTYGKSFPLSYLKHKKMKGSGFYGRLLFIPLLLGLIVLSFFWGILIYFAILQLLLLFFSYCFVASKIPYKNRNVNIVTFSFVHTIKQLAQMMGIWFGFFERAFSKSA
jgi:glycosyltransferase involved in cell wall biosynthesis